MRRLPLAEICAKESLNSLDLAPAHRRKASDVFSMGDYGAAGLQRD